MSIGTGKSSYEAIFISVKFSTSSLRTQTECRLRGGEGDKEHCLKSRTANL